MDFLPSLFLLAMLWLAYFIIHSILASLWLKTVVAQHYPNLMPFYRLIFNTFSILALLPILNYRHILSGDVVWSWQGNWVWLAYGLAALAIVGFVHSLKFYDMQEFMGFRQLKEKSMSVEDQEHLHLSPYHRFVRHPWYFFALILIWIQNMDTAWLVSSVLLTLYFVLGSKLEDKKLVVYYGERYIFYENKVCGILPLPWMILSKTEVKEIQNS